MEVNTGDEECCCKCGTGLGSREWFLCYDCQQDKWYNEDQEFNASWFYFDEPESELEND